MPTGRWEWKLRHVTALCLAALLAGALLGWEAYEFVAIDACLDRGGAWNHSHSNCEYR